MFLIMFFFLSCFYYISNVRSFATCGVLCCRELLPELLRVVRVELVVEGGAQPVGLGLVEDGGQGVGDVDDATRFTGHHKQEAVRRLQNQMLQFLQTEGGFI